MLVAHREEEGRGTHTGMVVAEKERRRRPRTQRCCLERPATRQPRGHGVYYAPKARTDARLRARTYLHRDGLVPCNPGAVRPHPTIIERARVCETSRRQRVDRCIARECRMRTLRTGELMCSTGIRWAHESYSERCRGDNNDR